MRRAVLAQAANIRAVDLQRNTRMLVVAPHPDDDVIGCGGTMFGAAALGALVKVVYVTDGSASHPGSKRFPPARLRLVRQREARAALRTLGIVTRPTFLDAPDGKLAQLPPARRAELARVIAATIDAAGIDVVFGPWREDPHADHQATAALVDDALARCGRPPRLYSYPVWLTRLDPSGALPAQAQLRALEVPLGPPAVAKKRAALLQHRSQTSSLIDDDPAGFRIDAGRLERWLEPVERFYVTPATQPERLGRREGPEDSSHT